MVPCAVVVLASVVVEVGCVVGGVVEIASVVVACVVEGAGTVVVDGRVIGGMGSSSMVNTSLSINPDPCSTTSRATGRLRR